MLMEIDINKALEEQQSRSEEISQNMDRMQSKYETRSHFNSVLYIAVILVFVFVAVKQIRQWLYNNAQPKIPVEAAVVSRRTKTESQNGGLGWTTYYATFRFHNGEELELKMNEQDYEKIAGGARGILTFQGNRFIDFEKT